MMRINLYLLAVTTLLGAAACVTTTRQTPGPWTAPPALRAGRVSLPGKRPDGSVLLPNQWSLRPAGRQVELADFPINVAVHPGGRFAAVLHGGFSAHQIIVVDVLSGQVVSRTEVGQAFYGVEFSKDGKQLFCSGAGDEVVHCFEFEQGSLANHREIKLRDVKERGVPSGLALDNGSGRLYVANVWGDRAFDGSV